MTREEFIEEYLPMVHGRMVELSSTKGREYAGMEDTHANFRRLAERLDLEPRQVLMTYLAKHLDAIESWVRDGLTHSEEGITGRIDDAILYLILLRAMTGN